MGFIFIDRRKATGGKSSANREKLYRRIKSYIKTSKPNTVGTIGGVTGQSGGAPTGVMSPVKVAAGALEEPNFAYARGGWRDIIFLGNSQYTRGDEIIFPSEGEDGKPGGAASGNGNSEDEFIAHVARDQFLDYYYEDCELPNLVNEKYTEKLDTKVKPNGFTTVGSPSQLSIIRTYKQSIGRRRAMSAPYVQEQEQLQEELAKIYESLVNSAEIDIISIQRFFSNLATEGYQNIPSDIAKRIDAIIERLTLVNKKIAFFRGFDNSDMRFRKSTPVPLKTVDAVIFMLMDISGSMSEQKKRMARRWFALFYGFIKRRYPRTELVFIAHTDEAAEMDEDAFFKTQVNGGTAASSALKKTNEIIRQRFDHTKTNIYVSHASDGDNAVMDFEATIDELVGGGNLMSKIQFLSYVEVDKATGNIYSYDSELWKAYAKAQESCAKNKITLAIIQDEDSAFEVFKKVFRKGKS